MNKSSYAWGKGDDSKIGVLENPSMHSRLSHGATGLGLRCMISAITSMI